VIVDGKTVVMPFYDAVANTLNDVPFIIEINRDEEELFMMGDLNVVGLNANQYNQYLHNNFLPWSNTTGDQLAKQYQNITMQSVTRSFYDLKVDIALLCGNIEIGIAGVKNWKSPIYLSFVNQPPSHPIYTWGTDNPPLADPFHLWDYMGASGAWNMLGDFTPNASDLALGDLLYNQLIDLVLHGNVSKGMKPMDITILPSYTVAVQGDYSFSSVVANTLNFKQDYCNLLKELKLNPDSRFWWVN